MDQREAEISDVDVILDPLRAESLDQTLRLLKSVGLQVVSVDAGNGMVEGTIETAKIQQLRRLPGIAYVRNVMTYIAEYPPPQSSAG